MFDQRGEVSVGAVCEALRLAQPGWADLSVTTRAEILRRWCREIEKRRADLTEALRVDTGRLSLSEMEVDSVIANVDRCSVWAENLLKSPVARQVESVDVTIHELPVALGVAGVIAPWNFPLQLALIDAVPALLAGCAVLVKPSELTSAFVPILADSIAAVTELADVLKIVEGGPEVGRSIVECVDVVCFTGSVRTGRDVARAAADRFIPAFLELGGKDAAVVAGSANIDIATSAVLWGATANAGQSCMSIERVYVVAELAEQFVSTLTAKATRLTIDTAGDGSGDISRFINPAQADVVASHLSDAVARGAEVRCGGEIRNIGNRRFLPPTVLTGVNHSMRVMTEETFGPVIPVMSVDSVSAAVALANDSDYGLSAAVFAEPQEALAIAGRLEAGGISINDVCVTGIAPVGEKQAFKYSGLGPSRMGPEAVSRFLRKRIALVREQPRMQPWWYAEAEVSP